MKGFLIAGCAALAMAAPAQEFRVRVNVEGGWAPVVPGPSYTFKDGRLKGATVFTFGGFDFSRRPWLGGFGIEGAMRLSTEVDLLGALALEFSQRKPAGVVFIGVRYRG